MKESKSADWLIKNAIGCFLYHYPEHRWAEEYKQLIKKDYQIKPRRAKRAHPKTQSQNKIRDSDSDATHRTDQP